MPLTKQNIEQIYNLRTTIKDKRYLHGIVPGLDNVMPYSQVNVIFDTDYDYTTYFVAVATIEPDKGESLKELLSKKMNIIDTLRSHDPEEIEKFIQKWLDKDFKFV